MGGYRLTDGIFSSLREEISSTNMKLIESLKGNDKYFNTIEYIKVFFSDTMMEDVEFLNTFSGQSLFKVRHAQIIMRDLLEQVIEFIFLMKHPDLISEYVGENIDIQSVEQSSPVKGMKKLASGRYSKGRKSVAEMARDVGESKSKPGHPALYELYCLLSEECHNSYFFARLDDYKEYINNQEILALSEDQAENLGIIIRRFMEAYRT